MASTPAAAPRIFGYSSAPVGDASVYAVGWDMADRPVVAWLIRVESSVVATRLNRSCIVMSSMPLPRSIACRETVCWPAAVCTATDSGVSSMFCSATLVFCEPCRPAEDGVVIREISIDMPFSGSGCPLHMSANGRSAAVAGAYMSVRYCGTVRPANAPVPTARCRYAARSTRSSCMCRASRWAASTSWCRNCREMSSRNPFPNGSVSLR